MCGGGWYQMMQLVWFRLKQLYMSMWGGVFPTCGDLGRDFQRQAMIELVASKTTMDKQFYAAYPLCGFQ